MSASLLQGTEFIDKETKEINRTNRKIRKNIRESDRIVQGIGLREGFRNAEEVNEFENKLKDNVNEKVKEDEGNFQNNHRLLMEDIKAFLVQGGEGSSGIRNTNIRTNNGDMESGVLGYVNNAKLFKGWPSEDAMNGANAGNPKCPTGVNNSSIIFTDSGGLYSLLGGVNGGEGVLLGSMMKPGPSGKYGCGNEGLNISVTEASPLAQNGITYYGCYRDPTMSRLQLQRDLGATTFNKCKQRAIDMGCNLMAIQQDPANPNMDGFCMIGKANDYGNATGGGWAQQFFPNTVPVPLMVIRLGGTNWAQLIRNQDTSLTNIQGWWPDGQAVDPNAAPGNQICLQFRYFAEYWLNRNNVNWGSAPVLGFTQFAQRIIGTFYFSRSWNGSVWSYSSTFNADGNNAGTAWFSPWWFWPMSQSWTSSGGRGTGQYDGQKDYKPPETVIQCNTGPSGQQVGQAGISSALYWLQGVDNSNVGKVAHIDIDGNLWPYSDDMVEYGDTYRKVSNYYSGDGLKSVEENKGRNLLYCKNLCNKDRQCGGYANYGGNCYLYNKDIYPKGKRVPYDGIDLYVRNKKVRNGETCSKVVVNVNNSEYGNYPLSGKSMSDDTECGFGLIVDNQYNKTEEDRERSNRTAINARDIVRDVAKEKDKVGKILKDTQEKINRGVNESWGVLDKIVRMDNSNITDNAQVMDTEMGVYSDNYKYVLWSIGTIIVAMSTIKLMRSSVD